MMRTFSVASATLAPCEGWARWAAFLPPSPQWPPEQEVSCLL
jgi:hypothetical protein